MNKVILVMICIIVVIGAMLTAIAIFQTDNSDANQSEIVEIAEEEILDECTEEYEKMQNTNTLEINSEEEKTSPNCSITTKTYYQKCGHTKSEYANLPQNLVNLTKDEIQKKYQEYEIESFASNKIILYQEKEGECGEHYMVKDKDGMVTIYQILEDGSQKEQEVTGVSTEYLPETDRINMKNGIQVNGKQQLNQLIEDFE